MKNFTDIGQFRNVIRAVKSHHDYIGKDENDNPIYRNDTPYPTIKFRGTIKLHGTNAAVIKYKDGHYEYQSRERVLNIKEDNKCFMLNMLNCDMDKLFSGIEFEEFCGIYGEWVGSGIQGGTALSRVPKMWVIFAVRIDNTYQDMANYKHLKIEDQRIFNILQFPYYEVDIDFNNPEDSQNKLVDYTTSVEKECPVGKYFGSQGVGEGVVWEHINDTARYIFKVKGEKHQNSKVKKLATVDVEAVKNIKEFVEYAVTENRMLQGIDKMVELHKPLKPPTTGDYIKWVYDDVIKEEQDTIVKNGIDPKKLNSYVAKKAQGFWFRYINELTY